MCDWGNSEDGVCPDTCMARACAWPETLLSLQVEFLRDQCWRVYMARGEWHHVCDQRWYLSVVGSKVLMVECVLNCSWSICVTGYRTKYACG